MPIVQLCHTEIDKMKLKYPQIYIYLCAKLFLIKIKQKYLYCYNAHF